MLILPPRRLSCQSYLNGDCTECANRKLVLSAAPPLPSAVRFNLTFSGQLLPRLRRPSQPEISILPDTAKLPRKDELLFVDRNKLRLRKQQLAAEPRKTGERLPVRV